MAIDYTDSRFANVESAKQDALADVNNTYNTMIEGSDAKYNELVQASKDYATQQSDIQQQQTNQTIAEINQQKDQTEKDYTKEQTAAYTDYQKQSNQYGVSAEQQASQGLQNSGYSETSRVAMYTAYQNRYAVARESYNQAVVSYNNQIAQAQISNSAALAEIAYNALQTQLQTSIEGFQYKNTLLQNQLNAQQTVDQNYYGRWQDVVSQINTENSLAEQIRQYNESMAYQKQRDAVADAQWQKEYALSASKASGSGGSSGTTLTDTSGNEITSSGLSSNASEIANKISAAKPEDKTSSKTGVSDLTQQAAWRESSRLFIQQQYQNGKISKSDVTNLFNDLNL